MNILALVLAGCLAQGVGGEEFQETAQAWCDLGIAEAVYVEYDEEADRFTFNLTLNQEGYIQWIQNGKEIQEDFLERTKKVSAIGTKVKMQIRHKGDILYDCSNMFYETSDGLGFKATCEVR